MKVLDETSRIAEEIKKKINLMSFLKSIRN